MCHKILKKNVQILTISVYLTRNSEHFICDLRNIAHYGNHQHF